MPTRQAKATVIAIATALLSGCAVVGTLRERNKQASEEKDARRLDMARKNCISYGFADGTDAFASCLQSEVNSQRNRDTLVEQARKTRDSIESTKPK